MQGPKNGPISVNAKVAAVNDPQQSNQNTHVPTKKHQPTHISTQITE